jgi:hypothetical protein
MSTGAQSSHKKDSTIEDLTSVSNRNSSILIY